MWLHKLLNGFSQNTDKTWDRDIGKLLPIETTSLDDWIIYRSHFSANDFNIEEGLVYHGSERNGFDNLLIKIKETLINGDFVKKIRDEKLQNNAIVTHYKFTEKGKDLLKWRSLDNYKRIQEIKIAGEKSRYWKEKYWLPIAIVTFILGFLSSFIVNYLSHKLSK